VSAAPPQLRATHTHLYPGARLLGALPALRRGQRLAIAFADLGHADARVEQFDAAGLTLAVAAHRTARGTPVAPRCWLLQPLDAQTWRVARRLPADG
jgi:hypothetical protein